MIKQLRIGAVLTTAFVMAVVSLGGIAPQRAVAATPAPKPATQSTQKPQTVSYEYVAQQGDSYTKFARKAVQTYGKKYKVSLSNAQIVFAETSLTQAAGSPLLNLGEKRTFSEASVKSAVEKAGKLTTVQIAAWNVYAKSVNFNTDKVGQKS